MSRDINLTHQLGEWKKRPDARAPEPAPPAGHGFTTPVERRPRFDPFALFAYVLLAVFLAGQFFWLLMEFGG